VSPMATAKRELWQVVPMGKTCPHCDGALVEIDLYGEHLIGCVQCNLWEWRDDDGLFRQLKEEDIAALRERVRPN
jgi:hypothetical protein